ncbi:hypothetical protein CH92_04820 [Stutzerimonas stutzeri]|uniref:DUF2726 domain-containing protein n=1 Tax=Stutzerimonas stutzeri TaxID=316 RepID=W8RQX9_STUST|nr:DUF2726 domain-containing protein [Stutzerimonas stutzeri]AHL74446.1 hypothetical protein CH92_04820 [Stutzerimonas stutzeri]MCQ4328973.1 DUF2726 domain-containing protein [Stutzerimonas stutzeri]
MTAFLGLVLVAFVCFALVFYIKQRQFNHPALRMPYQLKRPFLQPSEKQLLALLQQAVGEDYLILVKVRLAEVAEVTAIPRRAPWYQAVNRISAACFDFLLCDRETLEPRCAIEMEQASETNAFLGELCQTINLPLVRLTPETARSYGDVRTAIDQATTAPS